MARPSLGSRLSVARDCPVRDRYEFIDMIGSGTFGKVFTVRQKKDGKIYACKEIIPDPVNRLRKEDILTEINALRTLKHPSIVAYVDRYYEASRNAYYIVMEFAGGGDLGARIRDAMIEKARRGPSIGYIEEDSVWCYLAQIVNALHACHNHTTPNGQPSQILHRDLKPQNILLDKRGRVKLADFGLCKELAPLDYTATYCGTQNYLSPEQVRDERYDYKSDIWALGCIAYELCALKPLIHAPRPELMNNAILALNAPRLPRCYSAELTRLIQRLLSQDRRQRPSTQEILDMPQIQMQFRSLDVVDLKDQVDESRLEVEAKAKELQAQEVELQRIRDELATEAQACEASKASLTEAQAQYFAYQTSRQDELDAKEAELTQADATWRSEKARLARYAQELDTRASTLMTAERELEAREKAVEQREQEHQAWLDHVRSEWNDVNSPHSIKTQSQEKMLKSRKVSLESQERAFLARERALQEREEAFEQYLQSARDTRKLDKPERRQTTLGTVPENRTLFRSTTTPANPTGRTSPRRSRRATAAPALSSPTNGLRRLNLTGRRVSPTGGDPAAYADADEVDEGSVDQLLRHSRPSVPEDESEANNVYYPEASTPAKKSQPRRSMMSARAIAETAPPGPARDSALAVAAEARPLDDSDVPMMSIDGTRWTYDSSQPQNLLPQTPRKSGTTGAALARAEERAAAGQDNRVQGKPNSWQPPDSPVHSDSSVWDDSQLPSPYLAARRRVPRQESGSSVESAEADVFASAPSATAVPPATVARSTRSPSRVSLAGVMSSNGFGSTTWTERRKSAMPQL